MMFSKTPLKLLRERVSCVSLCNFCKVKGDALEQPLKYVLERLKLDIYIRLFCETLRITWLE